MRENHQHGSSGSQSMMWQAINFPKGPHKRLGLGSSGRSRSHILVLYLYSNFLEWSLSNKLLKWQVISDWQKSACIKTLQIHTILFLTFSVIIILLFDFDNLVDNYPMISWEWGSPRALTSPHLSAWPGPGGSSGWSWGPGLGPGGCPPAAQQVNPKTDTDGQTRSSAWSKYKCFPCCHENTEEPALYLILLSAEVGSDEMQIFCYCTYLK